MLRVIYGVDLVQDYRRLGWTIGNPVAVEFKGVGIGGGVDLCISVGVGTVVELILVGQALA